MRKPIQVRVNRYGPRNLTLRWTDPETGERHARSAGTRDRRVAERLAGQLEQELNSGTYREPCRVSWDAFCDDYCEAELPQKKPGTRPSILATIGAVNRILKPRTLADLTTKRLADFQRGMVKAGRSPETATAYLSHISTMLKWAVEQELLAEAPKLPKRPKRKPGSRAKGRAITAEEYDRMVAVTEKVVGTTAAPLWRHLLQGLWLSGLRLGEALALRWRPPGGLVVDFSGRRPMLVIQAEAEKGGRDRLLPITPDFAEFLEGTPEHLRHGRVFRAQHKTQPGRVYGLKPTSALIGQIGERAGIKVHTYAHNGKVKFASAHDLRRSFGTRWSLKVRPVVLMQLMRHSSLTTTLNYYVSHDAQSLGDEIWGAWESGNHTGTPQPKNPVFFEE